MIRYYSVYKHTNLINNKCYIGITSQKPSYRWGNGTKYKTNKYFYHSILKYGWNNFKHEIIANNLTEEAAKILEQHLIEQLNSTNPDFGYNQTIGGEGNLKYKTEEERYIAIRKSKNKAQQKLRLNPEYRAKEAFYAKTHKQKISKEQKKQYNNNYFSNPQNKKKKQLQNKSLTKIYCQKRAIIRAKLKNLYNLYPEYFNEEQKYIIFGRNGHNYAVNALSKLQAILEALELKLSLKINNV